MDDHGVRVGKFLRETREARGLSQADLATELSERINGNYFHTTIGKMETGKRGISLMEAVQISDVLSIEWDALFKMLKPSSKSSDMSRIGISLLNIYRRIEDDLLPALHAVGDMLTEVQEKYSDSRALNGDVVNQILDGIESDLESVRSIYSNFNNSRRKLAEISDKFDTAGLILRQEEFDKNDKHR